MPMPAEALDLNLSLISLGYNFREWFWLRYCCFSCVLFILENAGLKEMPRFEFIVFAMYINGIRRSLSVSPDLIIGRVYVYSGLRTIMPYLRRSDIQEVNWIWFYVRAMGFNGGSTTVGYGRMQFWSTVSNSWLSGLTAGDGTAQKW